MSTLSTLSFKEDATADPELWETDYVNEEHIQAFAQALSIPDTQNIEGDVSPSSPKSPPPDLDSPTFGGKSGPPTWKYGPDNGALLGGDLGGRARVEKLTATSDFAPIHQRVSRRRPRSAQQGLTYNLIRWPLLAFLFLIIYLEFGAYVATRQVVNVFEWLVSWRGRTASIRKEMRHARTYQEWVAAAKKMDAYLGFDEWKETEEDSYFDHTLVKRVRRTLTRLRAAKDTRGVMDALAICVRSNFAGTEGVKMYSETFYGTKRVVEAHINEVVACLDFVRRSTDVSMAEKRVFFRAVNKNYGSSALCLSGGASFGYYHFGVIKAFLEADLLPRVVTGTSAGGVVAALLCTRTDEELKKLLVPRIADKITACEDSFRIWFKRFRQTGARFSSLDWARKAMFFTYGSLTFKEAYERTGRALNVSVVPADRHSPTILLNHLNAPNCIIWSAIIASAAVPGILNPVVLMAKDRNGQLTPHNLGGSRFKDGSLREDIPLGSLHTQFNCNFSIVSQTNPHIHLFFFAPRGSVGRPVAHRKGKGWRGGFILSALESYIKLDLTKHFKVIRDLDLLPQILQSDWSGVFLQRFSGDLTLTPRSTISDWFRILSDPDRKQLARMLSVGQRVTWPSLHLVRNRMTIERAIFRGRSEVRTALHRDRTSNDPGTDHRTNLLTAQIPIESDADAGFISRTRKARSIKGQSAPPMDFPASPSTVRRRKGTPRSSRRLVEDIFDSESSTPADQIDHSRTADNTVRPKSSNTLSDTFRHVRAASVTALGGSFSPFRRSTAPPYTLNPTTETRDRRRSQLSMHRWFGNLSDSSSEQGEGDRDTARPDSPSGPSDGELPSFRSQGRGGWSAVADDEDAGSESEAEGVVPIPGGERVSQDQVDGSGAAGERLMQEGETQYSPPGQDSQDWA